jgi:hypothetical protein
VHAHGRHHHLHNVHDLLHARYVKGRRAKGKKKKSSTRKLLQKRKRKGTLNCIVYAIGVYYSHSRRYFFFVYADPSL